MAKGIETRSIVKPGGEVDHDAERERELGKREVARQRKLEEARAANLGGGRRPAR